MIRPLHIGCRCAAACVVAMLADVTPVYTPHSLPSLAVARLPFQPEDGALLLLSWRFARATGQRVVLVHPKADKLLSPDQ
jgi:hypothetical protein